MAKDKNIEYTISDLVNLAKDDPLFAKDEIEKIIENTKKSSDRSNYDKGFNDGKSRAEFRQLLIMLIIIVVTVYGLYRIIGARYDRAAVLEAQELQACKEGKYAECLAGITRIESSTSISSSSGLEDESILYARVFFEATGKVLPGTSDYTGATKVSKANNGTTIIDIDNHIITVEKK